MTAPLTSDWNLTPTSTGIESGTKVCGALTPKIVKTVPPVLTDNVFVKLNVTDPAAPAADAVTL